MQYKLYHLHNHFICCSKMMNLNICVLSFDFPNNLTQENDKIRVSVTSLPDRQKFAETFDAKQISFAHPCFTFKFNDKTNQILLVFRKLSIFQKDPIIASTVIKGDQFPKSIDDLTNNELKTIEVYEPVQKMASKDNSLAGRKKKVLGKATIKLSLDDDMQFISFKRERKNSKTRNGMEYSNMIANFD